MNATDPIRALYAYNQWANSHILDAASRLDADDLGRDLGASFGSVQGNLTHLLAADNLWLSRWTGAGRPRPSGDDMGALARDLAASDEATLSYVEGLTDDRLDGEQAYTDTKGNAQRAVLWHTLLQVANHGTHHRAEIALLLTAMGQPPRQLDFIFYQLERAGAPPRLT